MKNHYQTISNFWNNPHYRQDKKQKKNSVEKMNVECCTTKEPIRWETSWYKEMSVDECFKATGMKREREKKSTTVSTG